VHETVARWVLVPPWWRPGVGIVHVLLLASEGVYERMFWDHPASSSTSALRLRSFQRYGAVHAL